MSDRDHYSVTINENLRADLRVAPDETESGIAVVEHALPGNKLAAPLHRHSREDEVSFVLEGWMGVRAGDDVFTVAAGEVATKPRGVWHTFWNPDPEPLRFLEVIAPGDFAWYFEELAELLPEEGPPTEETLHEISELGASYGFESRPESVPDLIEAHGLER